MAKREVREKPGPTLSENTLNGRGPAAVGEDEEWVTLRRASDETGVSISTLRSWYRKGVIDSRIEKGPNGSQRIVRLAEIGARIKKDGGSEPDAGPTSADGMPTLPADLREVIAELASARERAGRAEAKADFLAQELAELRAAPKGNGERIDGLEAENHMLRQRLELMRSQAEYMARRLSAIEGEPDEIDLEPAPDPAVPPEEEDEFLALTQRWKARRVRKKVARKSAKAARS